MDKNPSYSRPSKLKRRRKNHATASTQQAQSQIAAAIFSPSRSSRKRSLDSALPTQKHENSRINTDGFLDDVIVLPKVSDLLNIRQTGLTPMTVAAMTDYEISSSIENRSQQRKKTIDESSNTRVDEAIHHKILGTVNIKSKLKRNNYNCPFALPASHSVVDTDKREGNNADFFRGDGQSIEEEFLNIPWKAHDVSLGSFIKITSKNGATIRSKFDIDDNCTHLDGEIERENSVVIGKLKVGDIRPVLQSKWLDPPLEEANWVNNVGDDEFEDDELVGVMRYQIQLLECDLSSLNGSEESLDLTKGWISDRSRLKDEPFTICKVIESNK